MNLAKGTFNLTIALTIFLISSYVMNIWLGRFLGPENYGVYGIIISLMTIINVIQTSGIPQATSKYISEGGHETDSVLKSSLTLQIILTFCAAMLLAILAPVFASLFHDPSLTPFIRLSALILPTYGIYSLYLGYYNGLHKFSRQALMITIYSISKLIAVVILVVAIYLKGAILGFIVSPLIALIFGFHLPRSNSIFPLKKIFYFSIPLIAFAILSIIPLSLDLFFIKSLLNNNYLTGLYNATGNIAAIPYYGLSSFAMAIFPTVSKTIGQNLQHEVGELIMKILRYVLIILLPSIAFISANSSQILSLLYSSAYRSAGQALSVLIIGIGFLTLFNILGNSLNGSGRIYYSVAFSLLGVIATGLMCLFLIPKYGLLGAAVATSVGAFIACILALMSVYIIFGAHFPIKSFIKIFGSSTVIFLVCNTFNFEGIYLLIGLVVSIIMYLFVLFLLKEITRKDFELIKQLLPVNVYPGRGNNAV
jgi:stage V sporulation protein B